MLINQDKLKYNRIYHLGAWLLRQSYLESVFLKSKCGFCIIVNNPSKCIQQRFLKELIVG